MRPKPSMSLLSAAVLAVSASSHALGRAATPRTTSSCPVDVAGIPGLPAGAWDSHVHITDPIRFPPLPDSQYRPGLHSVWDNAIFEHAVGCQHVVLVQPSIYGTDNSLMTDSLLAYGPERAHAVVVFDAANTSAAQLRAWHAVGVRGARLNLQSRPVSEPVAVLEQTLRRYAHAIGPLGWVLQLYAPLDVISKLEAVLPALGVRVVLDHLGYPTLPTPSDERLDPYALEGFAALVRLLRQGKTWVKISGPYRLSRRPGPLYDDLDPVTRELFRVAPSRLVYASDWPHTRFEGLDIKPWTAHLLALTEGNEELRQRLFRDNARELWTPEG